MNRPEPRDGFDSYDEIAYQDQFGSEFDDNEDEYDDDTDLLDDMYDGQPSEYDEWMSFDPDC
jgi:hypothetical protein